MVKFLVTKYMANDDFSGPPRRADSINPIFIVCRILGPGCLRGPGFSLNRIGVGASIEPFFLGGMSSQRAVSTAPPPPPPRDPGANVEQGGTGVAPLRVQQL